MKRDPLQPASIPERKKEEPSDPRGRGLGASEEEMGSSPEGPREADGSAIEFDRPAAPGSPMLQDGVLADFFLYQERYLDDLAFNDPIEALAEVTERRRVDERWRAIERRGFPLPAATHSIALLSYWEARGSGRNGPNLPTPPDTTARLWDAALSRFAALAASEDFWTEWGVLSKNRGAAEIAAYALERHLTDELGAIVARLRESGDVHGEARFREHRALFRSELRAARALPALRILSGRGLSPAAIAAGPALLAEVGLLDKVRASVEAQCPDQLPLFSMFARIRQLVEDGEYESALGALERLDPAERGIAETRDLETRARFDLGLRALAADRTDEAFGHWERAYTLVEVRSAVAHPVSEAVLAKAKVLYSSEERDEAIRLLQRAVPFGERELLGAPLAHFLLERAEGRIARATGGEEDADPNSTVAEVRGAVADLEEAVALDPENAGLRERRNAADSLLQALLARAGPGVGAGDATAAPPDDLVPEPAVQPQAGRRSAALTAVGVALWVGIGLLALVAYPIVMPQHLGGTGTLVALGVAVGWIAANAVGWVLIR